jgi:hypothetical protein
MSDIMVNMKNYTESIYRVNKNLLNASIESIKKNKIIILFTTI